MQLRKKGVATICFASMVFLFSPVFHHGVIAGGTPKITGVSATRLTVPSVNDGKLIASILLYGENLLYLLDNAEQKNPPVIKLGPGNPKSISSWGATDSQIEVTFRIYLDDIDWENRFLKLRIYDTDGSVIQTYEEEIEIYDPEQVIPEVESVDPSFVSMTSKTDFLKSITVFGSGLQWLINRGDAQGAARLGPAQSISVEGNDDNADITFLMKSTAFKKEKKFYRIRIFNDGQVIAKSGRIRLFNPYRLKYSSRKTRDFINGSNLTSANKRTVGLNVQMALGASYAELEALYRSKLKESDTKWVREHISYAEVMGDDGRNWTEKYDKVFTFYKKQDIRVVAMLAYGESGSASTPPDTDQWRTFVQKVSRRYRNHVDAWEVWNEPDIAKFLSPNTVDALKPLMQVSYPVLKKNAPDSVVLNGPVGNIRTTAFVKDLYAKAGDYFDELSVHAYYCDEFLRDGNMNALKEDFNDIANARPANKRNGKIWVTELGCSMGTAGVDETVQKQYNQRATEALLQTGTVSTVLLYTIIDRHDQGVYEDNFGLLYEDPGQEKQSWQWYEQLPAK